MKKRAQREAIILAGGKGTRLYPYTTMLPKPLMPIQGMPVLEIVVRQLRRHGFGDITIATGHLSGLIESFFGDGRKFGVRIRYSIEDSPLGTAGPIRLAAPGAEDFLVMNGDLLTTLDYRALFDRHVKSAAAATIAAHRRTVPVNFGVLDVGEGERLVRYTEKPVIGYMVSMGIIILNRRAVRHIPDGAPMDIPDLMGVLVRNGEKVVCARQDCFWLDIGRVDDYQDAVRAYARKKKEFLPEDDGG